MFGALQRTEKDWQFTCKSNKACKALLGKQNCFWPRGKMLGGSSSMNLMLYVRGNRRDYDRWAASGNYGWSYKDVLPYFKKSEANQWNPFVDDDGGKYHSRIGPLKVDFFGGTSPFAKIFYEAGMERGMQFVDDINGADHLGYVNLQGTAYRGRRFSTAKAFLNPAMNRTNLDIIKNAFCTKVILDKCNRAKGIEFDLNGKTVKAYAKKEVIVSAGSVMSPHILMHSGIGPRNHLKELGIPCKLDLMVGHNLYDHLYTLLMFTFDPTPTPATIQLDNLYNYLIHNTGPLSTPGISQLACFTDTTKRSIYPDIEMLYFWWTQNAPSLQSYIKLRQFKPEIVNVLLEKTEQFNIGAILISVLQPKSCGYIRLNGTLPHNKPFIDPNYFSHPDDMKTMIRAVKEQASYINTTSYANNGGQLLKFPLEECDQFDDDSDEYWECYITYFASTEYHPVGTCKMGPKRDPCSVVDPELRVHNVNGLRVIDASM